MAETKIALYGSKKLSQENIKLVNYLCNAFLKDPHVVLINGGIYDQDDNATSVDQAAYESTLAFVKEAGQKLEDRLQTWLPEKKRKGVDRESRGKSIWLRGSPRSRRFQLVNQVDAIVTIEGEGHTETVLELAMALGRTVLPIGFSGTDSSASWESDREFFKKSLELDKSLSSRLDNPPKTEKQWQKLCNDIADTVLRKTRRRCLVLMDFTDKGHDNFYRKVVRPAIEKNGFCAHKLDEHEPAGDDILQLFLDRLSDCHAIIIDLTGLNRNVIYELGRIHEKNTIISLLMSRKSEEELPFYVSKNLVKYVSNDEDKKARKLVTDYLTDARKA